MRAARVQEEERAVPALAVVVIARNEELFIAQTLEAVLGVASALGGAEVVLVDSCSTDRTVEIARRYPVRVVRLRDGIHTTAALGRLVGERLTQSEFVLFVDGDTEIDAAWAGAALDLLRARPEVGGVGGRLRELHYRDGRVVSETPDVFRMTSEVPEEVDQLGGNAVYRRAALDAAGSFNPYVISYEEAELAERLRRAGQVVVRLPVPVGVHHHLGHAGRGRGDAPLPRQPHRGLRSDAPPRPPRRALLDPCPAHEAPSPVRGVRRRRRGVRAARPRPPRCDAARPLGRGGLRGVPPPGGEEPEPHEAARPLRRLVGVARAHGARVRSPSRRPAGVSRGERRDGGRGVLKLGITRLDDLERPKAPSGRLRHASLLLLRDLAAAEHAAPEAYDTLVARVKMPNGTWRQTAAGRLQQVDDLLLAELRPAMRRGARFRVLDLGVSTGVTSADLYERLRGECQVDFVASDLYRDLYAVRSLRLGWVVILDHLGHDVQYVVGRLVLPAHIDEARVYVANRLVKALARRIFLPEARRVLAAAAAEGHPYFVTTVVLQHEVARLPFFAFRCLDLARREPGFRFETIDVTHPIPLRADVVRAMNLVTTD